MTTGMTMPGWSLVAALNSLQKPMMFTPCWPRAGPTGGAGLAWPAGICNLICPVIFFAISNVRLYHGDDRPVGARGCGPGLQTPTLAFFHLPVFQFHWSVSAENIHGYFQ